jgi:hypothetical protein
MIAALLRHGWLGFIRAHYFSRSMGIKALIAFVLLTLLLYLYMAGSALPGILQNQFPDRHPNDVFFAYLLLLYAGDLSLRLFSQPVPRQAIAPYLHLPLRRSRLAALTLARSWFSPYNIYLLALLVPFFLRTAHSPQAFWHVITGCLLLSGISHSLGLLLKTHGKRNSRSMLVVALVLGLLLPAAWFFREELMAFSLRLGHALMEGRPGVFLVMGALIAVAQPLVRRGLEAGFYETGSQEDRSLPATAGPLSALLLRVPHWGMLWDMEWKLIIRNKRSRQNFLQIPLMMAVVLYLLLTAPEGTLTAMTPFLLMGMGSYGFVHLQYVFSWESRFFDYIASRDLPMETVVRARYGFHVLTALLQFLLLTPLVLVFKPGLYPYLAGVFLYAVGPVFCLLFYAGLGNSTRIDPNLRALFNFEGTSGTLFFIIILIFMTTIPLHIAGSLLPMAHPMGFSLAAGLTGLAFLVAAPAWTADVARRFMKKKYRNLDKYREK